MRQEILHRIGQSYSIVKDEGFSSFLKKLSSRLAPYKFISQIYPLGRLSSLDRRRETVLVVNHEGTRTGAPILGYNLVDRLRVKYNVVVLFLSPGPMIEKFSASGTIVLGLPPHRSSAMLSEMVVNRIAKAVPIKFALINSVESHHALRPLAKHFIPTISLFHEFAANTRPERAYVDALFWSGQPVFSSPLTRNDVLNSCPNTTGLDYPVIPQGRCALPGREHSLDSGNDALENARIRRTLRPDGFPKNGIVILGAGFVHYRKGVDLFIECAARVRQKAPGLPCRFIWVGKGYDPTHDIGYSVYLADQIRRAGLEEHVHFLGEVSDLEPVYAASDVLLLSSRLDPLPNVAVDALSRGLPVVCFDKTTGIADILRDHGLAETGVAEYLNAEDMARKTMCLAESAELRKRVGERAAKLAAETFSMANYVAQLERLAEQEIIRARQEKLDVETILKSNLPQMAFFCPPKMRAQGRRNLVRSYVRSWASRIDRRKLVPGFHPGIYRERRALERTVDPLADYLRNGRPKGPWDFPLITSEERPKPIPAGLRVGLHVHAHYADLFPDIVDRLSRNRTRPDLLISVTDELARRRIAGRLADYEGRVDLRIVPNRGRNIGPLLTEFGESLSRNYDVIGHLHTKKTAGVRDAAIGRNWHRFLLENLLGGKAPMADIILGRMAADPGVSMVFPDDPHHVGWGKNRDFVGNILSDWGMSPPPQEFAFPIGAMFWARPEALKPLFDLKLRVEDYPEEPLPHDGSVLHGLERLLGIAATRGGGSILTTQTAGTTRWGG
jgi:glycosyltransferase involved in cell wall biosynthesis